MYFPVVAMTRVATTTILLILLALLLPVFAIGADAFFALDKEAYELGQPVLVHIPSPDIGTTIVRITGPDGMHRYRGNAEQVEFYPLVLGHYSLEARHTQEHLFSQEFDVLSPVLESKPLPLFLEKQRYRVNQEVRFHLQLESGHDYRLHVSSEEEEFSFMGNLNPIAVFRPQTPGTYIVELLDRTANEIHEHGFLVEERRPINFLKLADRKGRSAQSRIKVYKGMHQIFDSDVDDELAPGVYNLELERPLKNIERIRLRGFNASTNNTLLLEEVKPRVRGKPALDGFAIDPTKTTFEDGTVTKRATGDELWKCAEWNFTTASCEGDWIRLRSLVPGELYTIDINSTDPAFVETSINVLNVQSYPMVGGTWRVEFTTLGIANLSIRAINGTTWNDILETEDLKLLSLKCGNENIPYTWQNSILFVEDYSCNATAIETSLVLTEGVHNLEFTFGNDTAYANNYASATGVLIFRDKTGGDDANAAEPGANVTWDTQDRLDIIYSHTSGEANITISTDGIYHLSYGIMVNRTDSTNNRNEITARVKVNGQILPSCYANTYLRAQTQNVYDGGIDSGCLLNLTAGDELAVNLVRTGGNYITKVTANRTHIDLRRLNHDDVFIAHDSGGGQDTNQVAGKNLTWDTLDVNGSSFNFTIDGEGVTVASDGLYRVMYGIDTYQTGGRYAIYGEILVNGQPQTQGYYVGFSRSNDGTNNAIAATEALIELNSGDEIKIRAGRASSDSRTVTSVGNHTWFHIERVSDNQGMVFIAHKEGTREDINSATGQLINFDTVDRQDAWFSQTDAETVQVLQDGAYYLYYSVDSYYAAGNTRWSGYSYVEVNGADNETCWGSSYVRGYPSSGGQIAEDSMGSGCILELQANDNLSIRAGRLSTGSIATTDYENRTWMFIMALDAIGIRPNVTSLNANPATVEFGGNVNVSADVVDNTAVDTVLIEIEEPDSTKTNYTTTNTSSVHWNDTFTPTQLGTHTFKIYANDTNGWTNNSETNTFSVQDTTKPSVSSLNNVPATGELAQFINLSADVSDTHGVQTVVIEVTFPDTSKQNYTTLQTSGSYWNATINTTQKGTYTFRFYANDSSGNMNSTETDTFTVVDTTVPAVSTLNAQPDPIDVPNQINISTIIRDHGTIDTVIIELTEPDSTETNLTTLQIGDSFYNQSFTTGQNGVHTYRIYANDTDGNMNSSETGTFEVKSDPNSPVVIALDAVPDPVTTYDTVNISLNATDSPSGVDIVIIEIAEPDGTKTNYSTKNISATFWNQSIPTSQNGIHTYRIYANDTVRNMNGSETSTFLATETEIPSVTALNDNPDPVEFNNTINLNATITDNVDVHIVLIEVEFPDTSKVNYTTTKTGDVYWNESIDTTKLGLHTYKIYSNDTANNRNDTESSTFTVQDTENPNVTAVTANQSLVILSMDAPSNIINLSATITDNAYLDTILIEVTFPDTSKQNFTTENVGDTYWNHSILITLNGTHTFRFIVNDTAGNTNVTETGTFDALKYGYLTVVLVNPLTDRNVTPNEFFNFTVNVTCLSGFCGDVNVSLDPQGNWWNDSFIHRRRIDLNNSASSESHTNFTILIKLDSTTIDYTHTNNDGSDIRFVDWDNTTVLGHDIELWNESGTSFVWVKIPTLDTSGNDSFWMYYGNESVPMANTTYAWKSNYAIVYHMDSSGNDSTDNDRDRVSTAGTPTYDVDFLGHEATFGTGNGWSLADISYWEAAWDERTHLVVFTTGTDIITDAAVLAEGGGTNGMGMYIIDGLLWANWWTGSNICTLNTSIAINTQYHVSMSYDNPGNCSLYVNGTRNQTGTTSTQVGGHTGNGGVGYPVGSKQLPDGSDAAVASFDGTIHEVHVFDSPESDAWHASMQRNLEDNIVTGVSQEVTKSKGLVSTVVSDLPFYTTDANPLNKTHDACLASMQWGDSCELTWSVNATGAIDSWFEFFAFALSNETRVDRNDTAKLNLTIQQNAGPPIIENVTSISPVTPLLAQNVTVLVNFTVSDIEGVDDLNDSSATVVFSRNGITRTGSCTPNDLDATTTVYNCSAVMTHYDPPGMWTVNVSVSDNRDWNASNATTSFTYNVLDAISLSTASYSFGSLNPGATAAGTDNPFRIDNQGNLNYTGINITAYNLINVSYIDVSNLTVNVSNALGTLLNNASSIIVPNAILEPDTNTGDRNESLYFYINVPAALPAGDYVASQNWEVISYE